MYKDYIFFISHLFFGTRLYILTMINNYSRHKEVDVFEARGIEADKWDFRFFNFCFRATLDSNEKLHPVL